MNYTKEHHFVIFVYGETYVNRFLDYPLYAYFADGNLNYIYDKKEKLIFYVYTSKNDICRLSSHNVFKKLYKYGEIIFKTIDDTKCKYSLFNTTYNDMLKIAYNKHYEENKDIFCYFFLSDLICSKNYIKYFNECNKNILLFNGVRVEPSMMNYFNSNIKNNILDLDPKSFSTISLKNIGNSHKSFSFNSKSVYKAASSIFHFNNNFFIANNFLAFPAMVKVDKFLPKKFVCENSTPDNAKSFYDSDFFDHCAYPLDDNDIFFVSIDYDKRKETVSYDNEFNSLVHSYWIGRSFFKQSLIYAKKQTFFGNKNKVNSKDLAIAKSINIFIDKMIFWSENNIDINVLIDYMLYSQKDKVFSFMKYILECMDRSNLYNEQNVKTVELMIKKIKSLDIESSRITFNKEVLNFIDYVGEGKTYLWNYYDKFYDYNSFDVVILYGMSNYGQKVYKNIKKYNVVYLADDLTDSSFENNKIRDLNKTYQLLRNKQHILCILCTGNKEIIKKMKKNALQVGENLKMDTKVKIIDFHYDLYLQ
jgi:hypothetical protein